MRIKVRLVSLSFFIGFLPSKFPTAIELGLIGAGALLENFEVVQKYAVAFAALEE